METNVDMGTGADQVQLAEVWEPADGTFSAAGTLAEGRAYHAVAALNDGTLLVAGGKKNLSGQPASTTEVFDPASGRSFAGAEMSNLRVRATATKLASGEVLIVGGNYSGGPVLEADLYR